uniref:Neurotransmitter-gated ion-channel transmembrane domain-containing protein n=1 Tax=Panagrolaimus sp. PS1159 TaxID=55785 RepID=A0AC35FRP6_9BILA
MKFYYFLQFSLILQINLSLGSKYADQLYEDIMYYYNKNVRPVVNSSQALKVKFGASLIRIIDVDEVNQVLTTNLWLEMQWFDYKLKWDPSKFNNIRKLHIPSDQIWIPDIILYNNADGEPHITIMSDAIVYYNGMVVWKPPSIYKSFCTIDITYYPYDIQSCQMKFGGWSYNGFLLDMIQLPSRPEDVIETRYDELGRDYQFLKLGMDLSMFYPSLEWDVIELTSKRHEQLYPGCCGQDMYIDITFEVTLRRKALFYTINLVIPCLLIAVLTTCVFYIPMKGLKMTFSISILVTLTVFYLVLIDLIPPTSLVICLFARYLLFTMGLVTASIVFSVWSLNLYIRDASTHKMSDWMRKLFLGSLPKYLCIKPPDNDDMSDDGSTLSEAPTITDRRASPYILSVASMMHSETRLSQLAQLRGMHSDVIRRMIDNVAFIADHFRAQKKEQKISEEWSYVAMIIDRLLLIIFTIGNLIGTFIIIFSSPVIFDTREPLKIMPPTKPLSGDTFEYGLNTNITSF